MKKLLISLIGCYQTLLSFDKGLFSFFAPGRTCKYSPSCSEFTKRAVGEFGVVRGLALGAKRIWSCK